MAWKLAEVLVETGSPPDELTVEAKCTFAGAIRDRELIAIHLRVDGFVPGSMPQRSNATVEAQRRYLRSCGPRSDLACELAAVL